ncbi:hypothetical protein Tco_0517388 [Tanacetum coccineum]
MRLFPLATLGMGVREFDVMEWLRVVRGSLTPDSHSVVTDGTNVGPSIFTAGTSSYTDKVTEVTAMYNVITSSCIASGMSNDNREMPTDNRSGVNLTDPYMSNAGLNPTNPVNYGIPNMLNIGLIPYSNIVNVIPTSPNKNGSEQANLQKLKATVANDAVMTFGYLWLRFMSFLKELLCVPVWVKFNDVPLVAYSSDGLRLIGTKIGTRYTKETIRVEYEWEPPHFSTCLIFGDSLDDYPKAPKWVNMMDKDKLQTFGADDDDFIKVKRKKSCAKNGGKIFKPVSVKQKNIYCPKAMQSAEGTINSPKTTPFVGTNKASTSDYNKHCTKSPSNKGNRFLDDVNLISLSNSFEALNVNNFVIEEVATGTKATTSGTQEKGQSSTPLVEKINVFEKQISEDKLVFVDDDGKPIEKVDFSGKTGSENDVEPVVNETTSYLASKSMGVGYGPKSLLDQWRDTVLDDQYDLYDEDMYEGQEISKNIQTICDNFDIKVRGQKKK